MDFDGQDVAAAICPSTPELQAISLINAERQKNGLLPLAFDTRLVEAARLHSQDMATRNIFSHDSLDGSDVVDRIMRAGYVNYYTAAENIAAGYATAEAVVAACMNSSGHRANILNRSMKEIGLGFAYGGSSSYRHYWTADFGASSDGPLLECAVPQRTLTVIVQGEGTVTPSTGAFTWTGSTGTASYPKDSDVALTAHAEAGSVFVGWTGPCMGDGACTLVMDDDMTVTAT